MRKCVQCDAPPPRARIKSARPMISSNTFLNCKLYRESLVAPSGQHVPLAPRARAAHRCRRHRRWSRRRRCAAPPRRTLLAAGSARREGEQHPSPQVQDLRAPLVRLAVFGLLLPRRCRLEEQGRKLLTHYHAVEAGHRPAVPDVKAYTALPRRACSRCPAAVSHRRHQSGELGASLLFERAAS